MNVSCIPGLAQALFEEAEDAHALLDPATELVLAANSAMRYLTGFTEQRLVGTTASFLVRSEVRGGMDLFRAAFHKTQSFHSRGGFLLRTVQEDVWVPIDLTLTRLAVQPHVLGLLTARLRKETVLERRVAERTAELAKANETLQAEIAERKQGEETARDLLQQMVTAQEAERRRIARELHDEMGQHLAALLLGLKTLRDRSEDQAVVLHAVDNLEAIARELGRRVRDLMVELRPAALDELGLATALRNLVEAIAERSQLEVDFQCLGLDTGALPPHIETCIYRIAQEALTNVIRHAEAHCVSLVVERQHGQVMVILEDDGHGFDPDTLVRPSTEVRRMGLRGIKERIELLRGTLQIESAAGEGTALFARLPLPGGPRGKQP
jgi:signal transduction histidine kinase